MKAFDTSYKLSLEQCIKLKNAGYEAVFRYLSLTKDNSKDLTTDELSNILRSGLKLGLIQHVRYKGWAPTGTMGLTDGENCLYQLQILNIPKGTTIFTDIEGITENYNIQNIISYINNWAYIIQKNGYEAGMYVGYNSYLTAQDLYYKLKVTKYWKSASNVPEPAIRGYSIIQTQLNKSIAGIYIDEDLVQQDKKGEIPKFIEPISYISTKPEKTLLKTYNIKLYNDLSIEID